MTFYCVQKDGSKYEREEGGVVFSVALLNEQGRGCSMERHTRFSSDLLANLICSNTLTGVIALPDSTLPLGEIVLLSHEEGGVQFQKRGKLHGSSNGTDRQRSVCPHMCVSVVPSRGGFGGLLLRRRALWGPLRIVHELCFWVVFPCISQIDLSI